MSHTSFPDPKISDRISSLAQKHMLEIVKLEHVENENHHGILEGGGDREWEWTLKMPNTSVSIVIYFYYPSFLSNIMVTNDSPGNKSDHFFLRNYLRDHIKCHEDYDQIQQVIKDGSWKENWSVELDMLDKHLEKNLGKIVNGVEWPDIYFNWQDYVEPAALDRIYQDQKDILDQEVPGKPRNAWVYFLDYFRKK